ncbi:phage tail protein [Portibacter marinus]|uniref:phage tail protein n=1 Tax=Portibacter marinus TaxID=2898660 RepID=UPI001F47BEC7|nr:phage tail protein [Portibacter marinus]
MASSADNKFPLPKFHFEVKIDGNTIAFQEVTGLTVENEITEYRNGTDKEFIPARRVSMRKSGSITLKKGLFKDDKDLIKIYDNVTKLKEFFSTDEKAIDVQIDLLDETSSSAFTWVAKNAVPTKLTMESLSASDNAIAIEQIEFSHSGIEIK